MGEDEPKGPAPERVNCFVVSVSQAQASELEFAGALVKELLETNFHHVVGSQAVKDDPAQIRAILEQATKHPKIQVVFFTGGTGIATRDNISDVLEKAYQRPVRGFGELYRMLAYQEMGTMAMLASATSGVVNGRLVFALPGSESEVGLALRELVLPELGRLAYEATLPTAQAAGKG